MLQIGIDHRIERRADWQRHLYPIRSQESMCLAVFKDISAANDNVNIDILCDRLSEIECSTTIIRTIHTLFAKRQLYFHYDNWLVETRDGFKGLDHGCTLLPLVFNVYTSNVGVSIPSHVKMLQYAVDVVIYMAGKNSKRLEENIQASVGSLGLYISPSELNSLCSHENTNYHIFASACGTFPLIVLPALNTVASCFTRSAYGRIESNL